MAKNICFACLFLVESVIAWIYLEYLFASKGRSVRKVLTFLFGYAVLFAVSLLDNTPINVCSFCMINFLLIIINYHCGWKTALVHSALLSFLMTVAEILIALLISLFGHEFAAYTYNFSVMVALVVMSKMLYLILALVCSRVFKPHIKDAHEPKLMALFYCLPILSAVIGILIIYIGSFMELNSAAETMIVLNVFALLIVNLIFLTLYNYLQRSSEERLSLQLSLQKEEADTAYYQVMLRQHENQRILIHDIKNHLNAIGILAKSRKSEEIEQYLSKLNTNLTIEEPTRLSHDAILNMVLVRFLDQCHEFKINFVYDIRDMGTSFMDAPSTTALFGNLLSNALEASAASADKYVELTIKCIVEQGIIIISLINSCDSAPILDTNGRFLSKKRDCSIHGVGLKSIERVVQKHKGVETMYYDKDNRRFHHIIQFPTL